MVQIVGPQLWADFTLIVQSKSWLKKAYELIQKLSRTLKLGYSDYDYNHWKLRNIVELN